jgi:SAM-dependent methyltransferase
VDQRLVLMHQVMLSDRRRLDAYDKALKLAVGAGDTVLDVGAGTLALSLLALRHGAGHVYAVEADPGMAEVAAAIARRNGLGGRVTVVQGDARAVRLPRKVDVVVSEMMGNLGPEEQMVEVLGAVARRNLAPGGRIVPAELVTDLAAIQFDGEGWGVWDDDFYGFKLDEVRDRAEPGAQLHFFQRPPVLLGAATPIARNAIGDGSAPSARIRKRLVITRPGRLHAIMGYFTATLGPDITLSNFPSYPGCNWAVWIWPLRPTTVSAGQVLRVEVHRPDARSVRVATDWRLECSIERQGGRDAVRSGLGA